MGQNDIILNPITQEQVDSHSTTLDSIEFYTLLDSCVIDLNNRHSKIKKLASKIGYKSTSKIIYLLEKSLYSDILYPMIDLESAWIDTAISYAGAIGLTQVMPTTAAEYGINLPELYDPIINTRLGIQIFEENIIFYAYSNLAEHYALTAYNKGREGARRYGAISRYSKTILRNRDLN